MSSINVSEDDFKIVASAAIDAKASGDLVAAAALDKIARKINASVSNANVRAMAGHLGRGGESIKWTDVPSVLI